jgi:hypothetical protein
MFMITTTNFKDVHNSNNIVVVKDVGITYGFKKMHHSQKTHWGSLLFQINKEPPSY